MTELNPATWESPSGLIYRAQLEQGRADCHGCTFDHDSELGKELCRQAPCMPASRPDCQSVVFVRA